MSFDWTSAEIAAAIRDLAEVVDKLTELVAQEEQNTTPFDSDATDTKLGKTKTLYSHSWLLYVHVSALHLCKIEFYMFVYRHNRLLIDA